jgi:IS1 family transposase
MNVHLCGQEKNEIYVLTIADRETRFVLSWVEAVNTDLSDYLKRLARKSRCFTHRMHALARNIQLFVYCYNHRQLATCG